MKNKNLTLILFITAFCVMFIGSILLIGGSVLRSTNVVKLSLLIYILAGILFVVSIVLSTIKYKKNKNV